MVDDNEDAAETVAELLRMSGNEVMVVHDGRSAVDQAAAFRPDVVLLDIGMPRMDGYTAARRIREKLPAVVLIAVTGWGRREDMREAAAAGFDHHLVKPVQPEQLVKLLATVRVTAGACPG